MQEKGSFRDREEGVLLYFNICMEIIHGMLGISLANQYFSEFLDRRTGWNMETDNLVQEGGWEERKLAENMDISLWRLSQEPKE